jgi:hypothetical protein
MEESDFITSLLPTDLISLSQTQVEVRRQGRIFGVIHLVSSAKIQRGLGEDRECLLKGKTEISAWDWFVG